MASNKRNGLAGQKQVIFLRHLGDLDRLKNAVLMKKIISLNTADYILKLKNFTRGRLLRMPTVREEEIIMLSLSMPRPPPRPVFITPSSIIRPCRKPFRRIIKSFGKLCGTAPMGRA